MPPPELTTSTSGSVASYRPPRTTYTPVPPTPPDATATAINRAPSLRKAGALPPPEPPVILSGGDADSEFVEAPAAPRASGSGSGSASGSGSRSVGGGSTRSSGASYEPFLSHAPPPVDSWIEVETTQGEYRLIVRLPGFKRDGITLATKKRRILHVVADSWADSSGAGGGGGGGHFERRISFGYDADLARVRAEFDGEILRVIIPRRVPVGMGVAMGGVGGGRGWGRRKEREEKEGGEERKRKRRILFMPTTHARRPRTPTTTLTLHPNPTPTQPNPTHTALY
ncbi:hypothetical protein B0H13DRAFT_1630037 [Mycena leptocephala]|nr:hypothetical protein B0H13DRAFT_1630037 [Mycena leptocephala]